MSDKSTASKKAKVTDENRAESDRLKAIWLRAGSPDQGEFGKTYDIGKQSAVANYLGGHSALNLAAATKFARGLGCKIAEFSRRLADEAQQVADAAGLLADENFVPIPRLSARAGAGPGQVNDVVEVEGALQFRLDFLASINLSPRNAKIISVKGGSMAPTIPDGSVLLINRADTTPRHNNIYAFMHEGGLLVKRFMLRSGELVAVSDAGDPDIHFDETSPPLIQGRVVWMGAKL